MTQRAIAIFAKPPVAGQTKSRLAAETSAEFAATLSGAMLADLIDQASGVRADVILFYPPESNPGSFGDLVRDISNISVQCGEDLGERMHSCLSALLNGDYDQVIIIGSDCITHSKDSLQAAFDALDESNLIIQPADDGGYVLIGMTTPNRWAFENIDWGSERVMAQTRDALKHAGARWSELPLSFDIDTAKDLNRLSQFTRTNSRPCVSAVMKRWEEG